MRKVFNNVVGLAFLAWVFYYGWGFATAEARVRALCNDVILGSSFAQVSEFAQLHGLSKPRGPDGVTFIAENRTFGRYGCQVTMSDGRVKEVEYNFND